MYVMTGDRSTPGNGTDAPDHPLAVALAATVAAVRAAASRRSLSEDAGWIAVDRVLAEWGARGAGAASGYESGSGVPGRDRAGEFNDPLDRIAAVFRLDPIATDLLLVIAAPDIDPNIAAAYGLLIGAAGPRPATVALALELAGVSTVSAAGRAALGPTAPLRRWGLVSVGDGPWSLGRSVTAGDDVIGALLGEPVAEPASAAMAADATEIEELSGVGGALELTAALQAGAGLCWVEDPPGAAGVALARTAFASADIRCVAFDLARRSMGIDLLTAATSAVRRAGLLASGVILTSAEILLGAPDAAAVVRQLAEAPIPAVLVGNCRWNPEWHHRLPVTVRALPLHPGSRIALWRRGISVEQVPDESLVAYRLTPEQILTATDHVAGQAAVAGREPDRVLVAETVRLLGGSGRIRAGLGRTRTSFDDLEVPAETLGTLERLAAWVRLRDTVIARGPVHGMGGKGTGITALFTGSPGTGKTLAAHVIADNAGLDLMQVDLSGVIDKYVGETEKNLERIFAEAESLNVVLFFDEADALFGKRSEVRDAHDRFANQEVSYLLQRMEQFDGITVLATNLKGNLDIAFARRMHFIVHFPDPDRPTRVRLWRKLLAQAGEKDPNDPIDVDVLAESIELSGGDIRNIVLSAVYDAAIEESGLGMRHILAAATREHVKLGRRTPPELLRT
jgi:hypothetical protein